jgi:hypothetical protein
MLPSQSHSPPKRKISAKSRNLGSGRVREKWVEVYAWKCCQRRLRADFIGMVTTCYSLEFLAPVLSKWKMVKCANMCPEAISPWSLKKTAPVDRWKRGIGTVQI